MNRRYALMVLAFIGLVAGILACNAPTPTPQAPSTVTPYVPGTSPPQETALPTPTGTATPCWQCVNRNA